MDVAGTEGRDPLEDFGTINRELEAYNPVLAKRPQVVAANKMDLPGAQENLARLKSQIADDYEIFPVSAVTGDGVDPLLYKVAEILSIAAPVLPIATDAEKVTKVTAGPRFTIQKEEGVYVVSGKEVERHFAMTDFSNEDALKRFLHIVKVMGIEDELRKQGAKDGDSVRIGNLVFDFVD